MGPFFSIIIPVYNGEQCIGQCLDSIYAQGLLEDDFEVICVNDASTDNTSKVILEYGLSHKNLRLITHEKNRRQGAARNTGLRAAAGEYILYIDADDAFISNALSQLKEELEKNRGIDILRFNHVIVKNGEVKECRTLSDSQEIMSGRDFIKRNSIPWVPWLCSYRRRFLIENNLSFVEDVLFEDADYVMNCLCQAGKMKYYSHLVIKHVLGIIQTTNIKNNEGKIKDVFKLLSRVKSLVINEEKIDKDSARVIMGHYAYMYKRNILRYWWRLPYKDRKELLIQNKPMLPYQDRLIAFIGAYPMLFLWLSVIAKPFLPSMRLIYLKVKGRT